MAFFGGKAICNYVRKALYSLSYLILFSRLLEGTAPPVFIDVPIHINHVAHGMTLLEISEEQEQISVTPIFAVLIPLLNQEGQALIETYRPPTDWIPTLWHFGQKITIAFQKNMQVVNVTVDPHYLKQQDLSLQAKKKKRERKDVVLPESFNWYSNFSLSEEVRSSFSSLSPSFSQFFGSVNGCFNYRDWVLDGFLLVRVNTSGKQPLRTSRFNRGNIFLTRDWAKKKFRFVLGDIYPRRISFQYSAPLFGLQILKNNAIFRSNDFNIGPIGQYQFFLNEPSQVDVYVNGIFVRALELAAGPHRLTDFPMADGLNTIDLKITDATSQVSWINLNQLYNPRLLAPGEVRYSISAGFPRFQSRSQRYSYAFNRLGFSSLFEVGLSPSMGLGGYLQGSKESAFSGLRLLHLTPSFEMQSELGGSYENTRSFGVRGRFTLARRRPRWIAWRFSADFLSRQFSYFERPNITPERFSVSGSISPLFSNKVRLILSGFYRFYQNPSPNAWAINGSLAAKLYKSVTCGILASYKQVQSGRKYFEAVVSFRFAPSHNPTLSSSYNTATKMYSANLNYYKKLSPLRSVKGEIGATKVRNKNTATGNIEYQGERGDLIFSNYLYQNSPLPLPDRSNIFSITRLTARTALVYAGGTLAPSRPVSDSFAIIAPKPFLKRYPLLVDPLGKDMYLAKSSRLLPAVFTRLPSYTDREIVIGSDDLPIGYDLGQTSYCLRTRYKSGFKLSIGKGRYYYVEGVLNDQHQQPIRYKSGYIFTKENPEEKIPFFTNAKGKFCIVNALPQEYQLALTGMEHRACRFFITGQEEEIIDLGSLAIWIRDDPAYLIDEGVIR